MGARTITRPEVAAGIRLTTGRSHELRIEPALTIAIQIDLSRAESFDDVLILRADDGSYETRVPIHQVARPHPSKPGFARLRIPDAPRGRRYTAEIDPGPGQGRIYSLFAGLSL